ncbi:DEAD/DEAH box helicase family protein [Brevundimonas sp. ZS04]|uniref:DEAD/DEAH box helicase family protein n=1 Tax=Brevundimonas sp. ZS04 TaxID=1906854 RepID=UPI00096CC402|nr:DEAD/DEAH box helicase family protein [Brevundimonas sp. ZS04]OMG57645.1 helicase [Brevundimonas sp. ZS04]
MKGFSDRELSAVDVELKEAVCDAIVNTIVSRVSGTDEEGRFVFGRSPRRAVVSGQLLPRFDARGEDETSDITIAALGVDFFLARDATGTLLAQPQFSVYVRVLPSWDDLDPEVGSLDFDFRLNPEIQREIDTEIRQNRVAAFKTAGVEKPAWRSMDEPARAEMRQRRAQIQEEVRLAAYAKRGIRLNAEDVKTLSDPNEVVEETQTTEPDQNGPDETSPPRAPVAKMVREGREIPHALVDPSPIPPKWRRLDLSLPTFSWPAATDGAALSSLVAAYNAELATQIRHQLITWLKGDGLREAWRDLKVRPENAESRERWEAFIAAAREIEPDQNKLLPDLSQLVLKIERQADFLDRGRVSYRVLLDNQCQQLRPGDALARCNAIFGTSLSVTLPKAEHIPLQLDRVEPSYRFRHYLQYPAIGLNCGVKLDATAESVVLSTTWAPRFVQPRITPTKISIETRFGELARADLPVEELSALPKAYAEWIDKNETSLKGAVRSGLEAQEADRESERLKQDTKGQRDEAAFIAKGIEVLVEAASAAKQLAGAKTAAEREQLERRAIPWRAWSMMNEAFFKRDGQDPDRGWRLFQLAFILAHIPTFASRMDEFREFSNARLDEEAASLLYFPTGGGKSEAFYGALLFALFVDRLRGKDRGITALIRYPLRLLTLQQAQRLLKLLAWAELVRRQHRVGNWPFEMGFWVGSANTPNSYSGIRADVPLFGDPAHLDDAALEEGAQTNDDEAARARRYRDIRDAYNKVPECPVCKRATGLRRNESEGPRAKRAAIVCFDAGCAWNKGHSGIHPLPFLLTDDTIYERAPSIVLGTVDKLAMLGQHTNTVSRVLGMFGLARWVEPNGHLFVERNAERLAEGPTASGCQPVFPAYREGTRVFYDPFPSLIIQDEAHLLEESLGTFSGLFDTLLENVFARIGEIAGDDLSVARVWTGDEWRGLRMPKIVAATATISNPERQLETLYQRRPLRFPYPGPDIYRSFFAEPATPPANNAARVALAAELPSHLAPEATSPWMRLYVSLMTNDATHTVTAVHVLSAFHTIISRLWADLLDPARRAAAIEGLKAAIPTTQDGAWRRAALERAVGQGREAEIMALVDLHRIALAYVTNKKGGDQIMDALSASVQQHHDRAKLPFESFDSRLISGGVDMKAIQQVMNDAGVSFEGKDYPPIDTTVRNIVATAAISHGVDVDRFNSMFFAGLPSDIAEYIQASSRVGRTHVGFVMLIPTPQSRRDRYVVETHDIFHRFLERMIAPPAVERWAENAVRRVLASYIQAWAMLREADDFARLADDRKAAVPPADALSRLRNRTNDMVRFRNELGSFALRSAGYQGRGPSRLGEPPYRDHYAGMVDHEMGRFAESMARQTTSARLAEYWDGTDTVFQKPMTSLRDVDEAGYIVASAYDPRSTGRSKDVDIGELTSVMRAIRTQKGEAAETDADGDVRPHE